MIYFDVEVEVCRDGDTKVNLNIHKFIIQDASQDLNIAQPFRVLIFLITFRCCYRVLKWNCIVTEGIPFSWTETNNSRIRI